MNFQYRSFEKELEKGKKELKKAWEKEDIYKTICYLRYLTCFYYTINYGLTDNELEMITADASLKLLGETKLQQINQNKVIFYDGFALAARGLAGIYVKALCDLGFEVTWIMYKWAPDYNEIHKKFSTRNVDFIKITSNNILDRMRELRDIVQNISPKCIFIYTTPDDVGGIGTFSTINGRTIRFLVDLTDHAFWLGKCATDYVIGFRNVGYNAAVTYRIFDKDKVLLLPYYPEKREEYSFEGMPFDYKKHEFVFSGGSPYKIEGSTLYEDLVCYILNKNQDMYFVFAGNGNNEILERLKKKYPKRFFQIDERKDLDQVMKLAKFYLSTYPMFGALMAQYAITNKCIPVSLCNMDTPLANPATLVLHPEKANFISDSVDEICKFIDYIMSDEEYYQSVKNDLDDQVISENDFKEVLESIILHQDSKYKGHLEDTDIQSFLDIYKKRASKDLYVKTIGNSRNRWVYRRHPLIWLKRKLGLL